MSWVKGDWPDLTNRQLALLMIICFEPGRHFVRHLAIKLDVPKSIICRVIDRLFELKLLTRETDHRDRRNVFAVPTARAFDFFEAFDVFLQTSTSDTDNKLNHSDEI